MKKILNIYFINILGACQILWGNYYYLVAFAPPAYEMGKHPTSTEIAGIYSFINILMGVLLLFFKIDTTQKWEKNAILTVAIVCFLTSWIAMITAA